FRSRSSMLPRELIRRIRRLDIATRQVVSALLAGQYHSVFKGRGMAFSEVRPYQAGDDIRSIDWNVTARTSSPHVKVFTEERELTVVLLVDVSASEEFGSRGTRKSEMAAEVAAQIAFSAIANNDRVGLLLFSDRVEKVIPPRKGRKHVLRLVSDILSFRPEGKGTDLALALVEVEDPETGERALVDSSSPAVRGAFQAAVARARGERTRVFRKLELDSVELRAGEDHGEALVRFFRARARRLAA